MRFSFAILSLVAAAVAQSSGKPNSFDIPSTGNYLLSAGQAQKFTWSNPSQGTVTIYLREGANSDLKTVSTLASNIPNNGEFTYTPPADIPEGANYALEIVDDQDTSITNYTPQFVIQSPVKAVQTSGGSTSFLTATSTASGSSASASAASTDSITSSAASSATASSNSTATSARTSGSSASAASTTGASASRTSGAAASSGTPPSTGAAAQGAKAASGLLALACGVAMIL